jgi:hypothetical protein
MASSPAVWQNDNEVFSCPLCSIQFNFLNRRHHCRICGLIYCNSCSAYRTLINSIYQRTCKNCSKQTRTKIDPDNNNNNNNNNNNYNSNNNNNNTNTATKHNNNNNVSKNPNDPASGVDYDHYSNSLRYRSKCCPALSFPSSTIKLLDSIDPTKELIIYNTASLCAKCSFIDRIGFNYHCASVFALNNAVYLRSSCKIHGPETTLISSNLAFYFYLINYCKLNDEEITLPLYAQYKFQFDQNNYKLLNLADYEHKLSYTRDNHNEASFSLPAIFELRLFVEDEFVADEEIYQKLYDFAVKYTNSAQQTFSIKLLGGLLQNSHQLEQLNDKIIKLVNLAMINRSNHQQNNKDFTQFQRKLGLLLNNSQFLIDLSYERMLDLANLSNSCLLLSRVYPFVRYFINENCDNLLTNEMNQLINNLKSIKDIQLILNLVFTQPYPNKETVAHIFDYLFCHRGFIRLIEIARDRSPQQIFQKLLNSNSNTSTSVENDKLSSDENKNSVDCYSLYSLFSEATATALTAHDFIPLRIWNLFNSLFNELTGLGQFNIQPHELDYQVCILISTPKINSIPLTRIFNCHALYTELHAILTKLYANTNHSALTLISAAKAIQKACKTALLPSSPIQTVPDLFSYLYNPSSSKASELFSFIRNVQLIFFHNRMDFASVDLIRRFNSANVTNNPADSQAYIATDTQCV